MKTLGKIVLIVFCSVLLFMPSALATRVKDQVIRQKDYGDRWAFTVPDGILYCLDPGDGSPSVSFATDDETYALNGNAKDSGYPGIDPIWRNNPTTPSLKADLSPFIQQGLKLCTS
jgi:hypothetical protein